MGSGFAGLLYCYKKEALRGIAFLQMDVPVSYTHLTLPTKA